jgi:hypothetical protein
MSQSGTAQMPSVKTGICELCGCEGKDLRRLVLWDYVGWTCSKCIEQIRDDHFGRIRAAGAVTEPAE